MLDISGFEGRYAVTSTGEVYSYKLQRYLRPSYKTGAYKHVNLYRNDGTPLTQRIHRLVAKAFIPNPLNLATVDHINGDKLDNRVSNLRWLSLKENTTLGNQLTYKFRSPTGVTTYITNMRKFCREHNLDASAMCKLKNGQCKQHKGWVMLA